MAAGSGVESLSIGEVGGWIGGAIAVLAALGKGLAWLLNWNEARRDDKENKLKVWEDSLLKREMAYRTEIERRLNEVQEELAETKDVADKQSHRITTLIYAVEDLADELKRHAPEAPALARAKRLLSTLKLTETPDDLAALAQQVDAGTAG